MRPDTHDLHGGTVPAASTVLLPVLAQRPGHLLWRAHARVLLALAEVFPPGVDLNAYAVLVTLDDDQARSQQDLADLLSTSRTTLARVAADLTAAGLLTRGRNRADRRSYSLTRTPTGARAVTEWTEHVTALEGRLTSGFSVTERAELADLLTRLLVATDEADRVVVPPALQGNLAFLVSRVHVRVHRDFLAALEPISLEPRLFGALTALGATGPISQADLARALGTSGASIVQVADDLERRGLVERRGDPADRRAHLLHLTTLAPAVHEQAVRIEGISLGPHFAALGEGRTARMIVLLQRFVAESDD